MNQATYKLKPGTGIHLGGTLLRQRKDLKTIHLFSFFTYNLKINVKKKKIYFHAIFFLSYYESHEGIIPRMCKILIKNVGVLNRYTQHI